MRLAETAKAAATAVRNEEERPAPFGQGTPPLTAYTQVQYQRLLDDWFVALAAEREHPNAEQAQVLHAVRDRILVEIELEKEGPALAKKLRAASRGEAREEPFRGFVHGLPGTGKSRVIEWIVRMFKEDLR